MNNSIKKSDSASPATAVTLEANTLLVSDKPNVSESSGPMVVQPPSHIGAACPTPDDEGLKIRRALWSLQRYDVHGTWVDSLIAHVQGKKLIERDSYDEGRPITNIKTYITNGVSILLTMFSVDADLDFVHRFHKFDSAGFRKVESSELLKPVGEWSPDYDIYDYALDEPAGEDSSMTRERSKRVLELLTNTGLLERKPNLNRTTLVIRLRADRMIEALKQVSPFYRMDLNY